MIAQCPNCHAKVSTRSINCPECHGPLRQPGRESTASVFKWTFVVFNVLMGLWIAFYLTTGRLTIRKADIEPVGDAVGTPIGGSLGLGFLVSLWLVGGIILGLCAAFSLVHSPGKGTLGR